MFLNVHHAPLSHGAATSETRTRRLVHTIRFSFLVSRVRAPREEVRARGPACCSCRPPVIAWTRARLQRRPCYNTRDQAPDKLASTPARGPCDAAVEAEAAEDCERLSERRILASGGLEEVPELVASRRLRWHARRLVRHAPKTTIGGLEPTRERPAADGLSREPSRVPKKESPLTKCDP